MSEVESTPPAEEAAAPAPAPAAAAFPTPREDPLLPARLTPFAPPDPAAEQKTRERLHGMQAASLRHRRQRIDRRLQELGAAIGEPALQVPSVRGTGLVDVDRILRKIDALDQARERAKLEREAEATPGLLGKVSQDLGWLAEAFTAREIRARRQLLVAELGLALAAADQRVLVEYAPHLHRLLQQHVATARRIDELFVQARLLDDEYEARGKDGLEAPPKQIEQVLAKAMDSVDDVSGKVGGALLDFGKSAAVTGGQAVWGLARGAAKGAVKLGAMGLKRAAAGSDDLDEEDAPAPAARPAAQAAPAPRAEDIPELIVKLAKLRDAGILTDREFQKKKAELLERL